VHAIDPGKPFADLQGGIASAAKGALTQGTADSIRGEFLKLTVSRPNEQQVTRTYAYLVLPEPEHQSVLILRMLSTETYSVDVRIIGEPTLMRAIRKDIADLNLDSLIPFDRGRLTIVEERSPGETPRVVLRLRTVQEFPCLGYFIDHELRQNNDTLFLDVHGIAPPLGPCPAAEGPARLARVLNPWRPRLPLVISYRKRRDRLVLEVSDSSIGVLGLDSSLVEADERPRWRYPRNSFAFHCSNIEIAREICSDVERWLVQQPGISALLIPAGWINPFAPDPAGRPDEKTTLYRYDPPASFDRLRLCFGAIDNRITEAVGVTLTLEDWRGDTIGASSKRSYDQPHIERPKRVTDQPACRTPSWRDSPD
jgi:hypothetical protein